MNLLKGQIHEHNCHKPVCMRSLRDYLSLEIVSPKPEINVYLGIK